LQSLIHESELSSWEHTKVIPKRSHLIRLEPRGLGTPFRESLSSYFLRLADAHSVSPNTFYRYLVSPELNVNRMLAAGYSTNAWESSGFNSLGQIPLGWTKFLQEQTCVEGLSTLCLLPLREKISRRMLMSDVNRWCPICIEESEKERIPFGQLLWKLHGVYACYRHGIRLLSQCGCGQGRLSSVQQAKLLPHICKHCGRSLGKADSGAIIPAQPEDIVQAKLLGELLGSDLFSGAGPKYKHGVSHFLKAVIWPFADGNIPKLARTLGKADSVIHYWIQNHCKLSLPNAVLIARTFSCSIRDVLIGDASMAQVSKEMVERSEMPKAPPPSHEEIRASLESMLRGPSPVSLAEAARRIGVDRSGLTHSHPEICKELTSRWREERHQESLDLHREKAEAYRDTARKIAKSGIRPTRRRVSDLLNGQHVAFDPRDREACDRACQDAMLEFGLDR